MGEEGVGLPDTSSACACATRVGRPRLATSKSRSGICIVILHVVRLTTPSAYRRGGSAGHGVAPAACNIKEMQDRWSVWICENLLLELDTGLHRFWILMVW